MANTIPTRDDMMALTQPEWVCADCGEKYGRRPGATGTSTWHMDECGVCKRQAHCTQPRDFGYLRREWITEGK
jgi:hypothetical protein